MLQINETRTFTSKVEIINAATMIASQQAIFTYGKSLYGNDTLIKLEEEIRVVISDANVIISRGKVRDRDVRQQQEQPVNTAIENTGVYTALGLLSLNDAIAQVFADYIAPLFS